MQSARQYGNRALRAKEAAALLGLGLSTFWKWSSEGKLPKGIRLSPRATVWRLSDLEAFLEKAAGE